MDQLGSNQTRKLYKKRPGTSGIRGQLYETKLLSLIYFAALHDNNTEEFYLGTNVDDIGLFDDICFRAKVKGFDKPIAVFIQAKHRENDKLLTLNSKKDLINYFDSYLRIKRMFQTNNDDVIFEGTFSDLECVFVMYTTSKDEGNRQYEGNLANYLNNLIGTCNSGSQPSYTNEDVEVLSQLLLQEQLIELAQKICKFISEGAKDQMMNDEHVLRYHVILAQKVFDISEVQPKGHRIARFRKDFFTKSEKLVQTFKDTFCSEILERRKASRNAAQRLLTHFLSKLDDCQCLSKLLGNVILLKNGKLEFRDKMTIEHTQLLDIVNAMDSTKKLAVELAVRDCIPSLEFDVPAAFGNKDLAIRGTNAKIEKRMDHLVLKLINLIEKTKPNNIVTIDESLGEGFLRLNGGIGSAVGNIFVLDDASKLMKFCDNYESLGSVAKVFFEKLQSKILNMKEYRFDVKLKMFPKLSLDSNKNDEITVNDFFSKLIFYTSQGDENDVEDILKDEIQNRQPYTHNIEIRSELIYLKFHDEVQKWWMAPKEGTYLTKEGELYKHAVDCASQPLTDVINMVHEIKNKETWSKYRNENHALLPNNAIIHNTALLHNNALLQNHQNGYIRPAIVPEDNGCNFGLIMCRIYQAIFFVIFLGVFGFIVSKIIAMQSESRLTTNNINNGPSNINNGWNAKAQLVGDHVVISAAD